MNECSSHLPRPNSMAYWSPLSCDGRSREIVEYRSRSRMVLLDCEAERQPHPASRSFRLSLTNPAARITAEIGTSRRVVEMSPNVGFVSRHGFTAVMISALG